MMFLIKNKNLKLVLALIFLILLVGGSVLLFMKQDKIDGKHSDGSDVQTSTGARPTLTLTSTPTPTPINTPVVTSTPVPTQTPVNPTGTITTINCTDCTLAPVDKLNALPSTYSPAVVATGLSGGGYLTQAAKDKLAQFFSAANAQGISITILSSYRSYANQQSTFEYWVQQEMAAGYSRAVAEQRANTYSARPGHSEHQLGTTVDLRCSTCASFDNSAGNIAVYNFIKAHGHEYGFVVSYPAGKENLTGYVAEAWHIRYIGVALATELYNRNYFSTSNTEYSTKFLKEKGLY